MLIVYYLCFKAFLELHAACKKTLKHINSLAGIGSVSPRYCTYRDPAGLRFCIVIHCSVMSAL